MPTHLIALTKEPSSVTRRIWMGGSTGPSSLEVKATETHAYTRVGLCEQEPLRALAAGTGRAKATDDGGQNWQTFTLPGGDSSEVRSIQWVGANRLGLVTKDAVYWSTDGGFNFVAYPLPSIAGTGDITDGHWRDDYQRMYILESVEDGGGLLHYTVNGGSTWNSIDMAVSFSNFAATESPRRVTMIRPAGLNQECLILTSHAVYHLQHNDDLSVFTATQLWDHEAQTQAIWGAIMNPTGWDSGVDNYTRYDDLKNIGRSVWLAGSYGLRAHSLDLVNFYMTDLQSVDPSDEAQLENFGHHSPLTDVDLFYGSSVAPTSLFPFRPGLNRSSNAGISITPYFVFPDPQSLQHHHAVRTPSISGCTHPDACNHEDGATLDDGSCRHAIILRDCLSDQIVHTTAGSIVDIACRWPRMMVSLEALDPATGVQSIDILIPGLSLPTYNSAVSESLLPLARQEEAVSAFVAWINSSTPLRATRVDPSLNVVVPGSIGGFWLYAPVQYAGAIVGINYSGYLSLLHQGTLDSGSNGRIVTVSEYPGRCFIACGQGDCALVETVTLVSSFSSCSSCFAQPAVRICGDCGSQVSVNGSLLMPNGSIDTAACASQGDTVTFSLDFVFPVREADPCEASVTIVVEQLSGTTWSIVHQQTVVAVDHEVDTDVDYVIPAYGRYRISVIASDCIETRSCMYYLRACEEIQSVRTGCHAYEMRLNRPVSEAGDVVYSVSVKNIVTGEALLSEDIDEGDFPIAITNDEDMVYLVEVTSSAGGSWTSEIIDPCDLEACRAKLIKEIACEADPCTEKETRELALKREEVANATLMLQHIHALVFNYRHRWTSVPAYSEERRLDLLAIGNAIDTARRITARCADCSGQTDLEPCKECN